ncbi:MAG: hypothetical protein JWR80_293 [Bradyrhizobium sp.]|nr:hypothetical protein [Bradyrhizobium sp.]
MRLLKTVLALFAALAVAGPGNSEPLHMGPPIGVSWSPTYGFPPHKPEAMLPRARAVGASFTRITLYWSQIEPKPGVWRWDELDAYLAQLSRPGEGFLTLSSASPWATRTASWVFPSSPAKQAADYDAFVRAVVARSKGRIRNFQSDIEPNNPFFWRGTAEEFAAQQRVFYQAVKAVDRKATVVLGGCDGLFDPTGQHPLPGQAADMAFFSTVIAADVGAYDAFDLRLYGDPYSIPDRVTFIRTAMAKAGGTKPILAGEYDGPGFFEFPANRRWAAYMAGPGLSPAGAGAMAAATDLPIETRMFLAGASPDARARLLSLQADDLVIRNLLALGSGIQKTAFFELARDMRSPDDIMFGSFRLFDETDGVLGPPLPLTGAFTRVAKLLNDASAVDRIPDTHPDVFAFRVKRRHAGPAWIVWRRPAKTGLDADKLLIDAPWLPRRPTIETMAGTAVSLPSHAGRAQIPVGSSPILIR